MGHFVGHLEGNLLGFFFLGIVESRLFVILGASLYIYISILQVLLTKFIRHFCSCTRIIEDILEGTVLGIFCSFNKPFVGILKNNL